MLVYLILKTNFIKAISAEIIIFGVLFLCGILLITIYTSISGLPAIVISKIPIHKFNYSLLLYFVLFIIYKILEHILYKEEEFLEDDTLDNINQNFKDKIFK